MKCPSCKNELREFAVAEVCVWVCVGGCGGFWFDRLELKKIDEPLFSCGSRLLRMDRAEGVRVYHNVEHICPQCKTTLLFRHFFVKKIEVEVDQCSKCGGYWIEAGTLSEISGRPDGESRDKAIDAYFDALFKGKLLHMELYNEDMNGSAQMIVKLFFFLSPKPFSSQDSPIPLTLC